MLRFLVKTLNAVKYFGIANLYLTILNLVSLLSLCLCVLCVCFA